MGKNLDIQLCRFLCSLLIFEFGYFILGDFAIGFFSGIVWSASFFMWGISDRKLDTKIRQQENIGKAT